MLIKYAFTVSACLLALMITVYKLYVQKQKHSSKTVNYTHVLIWVFALYILTAAMLVFFVSGALNKTAAAVFAASPFIIGRFASYEKETFYSVIQIIFAAFSAGWALLLF